MILLFKSDAVSSAVNLTSFHLFESRDISISFLITRTTVGELNLTLRSSTDKIFGYDKIVDVCSCGSWKHILKYMAIMGGFKRSVFSIQRLNKVKSDTNTLFKIWH